jgi:pimeloyl-ACP methyl ester carboxylesterase
LANGRSGHFPSQNALVEIPEIRYARSVGDIDIAYSEFGRQDGPRLVWVSGFISHLEMNWGAAPYSNLIGPLSEACRVIAFDKRGTGLSSRDLGFGSLADRADDIRAVMDACDWPNAHLFGMSEGGPLAVLFAATHPERVSSFSLYGTGARFSQAPDYPLGADPASGELFVAALEEKWGTGAAMGAPFVAHAEEGPISEIARFERNACTPKMAGEIMRRNLEIDVRSLLPAVRVPTLVVHAVGDPLVPVELGRFLAERIDGARYVELPLAIHASTHAEDYDQLLDAVIDHVHGKRERVAAERTLATVLFTDIIDSTQTASRVGDQQWRRLLDRHDTESRRCVDRFGGRFVKHTGDGMLATFDGPARGVQCAQLLSDTLAPLGLPIRAGLHTGEVEQRGDDVGGIAVHIGARVASLAGAGEVFVSRTVRDLVVGSDLHFEDRGTHELKGVPDSWQLYAAVS